jgi:hypothetical protein
LLRTKSIRREIAGENAPGTEYRLQIGSDSAQPCASFEKQRTSRAIVSSFPLIAAAERESVFRLPP